MRKWLVTGFVIGLMSVWLAVSFQSCAVSTDPQTGEKRVAIDSNVAGQIETGAQTAVSILTILGVLWPVLIPVGTGIAAGLGTWAKVKPKLTKAQSETAMYHSATQSVVTGIEDFKAKYPNEWIKLEEKLAKAIGPEAENIIRALRGLSPRR